MRQPTFFLSHGGGPWPYMDGPYHQAHAKLEAALQALPATLVETPKAILMISAHWEEDAFTVMTAPAPGMLYDYGGFPPHTYEVVYPAPGDPALAERVFALIEAAGLPAARNAGRGFDHGAFCTLAPMYPEAQIPVVQLSLKRGLDPAEHLALGRALSPLRDEGVLILGSGFSFHNMRLYNEGGRAPSAAFDAWLQAALPPAEGRAERLQAWAQAPAARLAHPREEHLLPLMVAAGAAEGDAGSCNYHETEFLGGVAASSFRFG
ncbi:DODA-type extradiol aromatic ring-opening family dioxygenase [Roseateles saccharophilus]|uniref:Aromatic ring-opening dioxygenase catalytic subunit (LigB family) n=1 Tax=Roseateles saccharophilus TaxID=304 RepID=A0A4V2VSG1_ROSSA|nr:class III extradiol ring-cleavage dioxygenase [Roseateles saccharophilus]MDG0833898.1 dioxygenase [Roseateles saccharophilus]TCV02280.1 aromatic ring-opening dioxygenase catalytic subunit (LigB family) [Roseateles saccharophilus]